MIGFKDFLDEGRTITTSRAKEVLGLTGKSYTSDELDKIARRAMRASHPDRNENTPENRERFADVKTAFDHLRKQGSVQDEADERGRTREQIFTQVRAEIEQKFMLPAFSNYFETIFKEPFTATIEFSKMSKHGNYNMWAKALWSNKSGTRQFDMTVSADLIKVQYGPKLLGGGNIDISYPLSVVAYGYADKKKIKVSQRDWKITNDHRVLRDPKATFPKAKITKKQTRKFAKRDMLLAITKEAKAKEAGDSYFIPLKTADSFVRVYRSVFMRTPAWTVAGISEKQSYQYKTTKQMFVTLPEDEQTADFFKSLIKMTDTQAFKALEKKKQEIKK